MLKVPQKVDHGVLLMRYLAERQESGAPLALDEVAKAESISQGYLEEVARLLRSAGLISGKRGAGGGYVLVRDPRDISLADIVTVVEGRTWTAECIGDAANRVKAGAHDAVWRKVQAQVMTTLGNISVADVVAMRVTVKAR